MSLDFKRTISAITLEWHTDLENRLNRLLLDSMKGLKVPRWVNLAITELDEAAGWSLKILNGDQAAGRHLIHLIASRESFSEMPEESGRSSIPKRAIGMRRPGFPGNRGDAFSRPGWPGRRNKPCMIDPGVAIDIVTAGYLLDIISLNDLTTIQPPASQPAPGIFTGYARAFLLDREDTLQRFSDAVDMVLDGTLRSEAFERIAPPDLYAGMPHMNQTETLMPMPSEQHGPVMGSMGRPVAMRSIGLPPPGPGISGPMSELSSCDHWRDCVDAIVEAAESYKPPSLCPDESLIGSLEPSAICRGRTGSELVIRPKDGSKFSVTGGPCNVWLQQSLTRRVLLEVLEWTPDHVRVRLPDDPAQIFTGCIGFRPGGQGGGTNSAFIDSCLKLSRSGSISVGVLNHSFHTLTIKCHNANRLLIIPPPVVESVAAYGLDSGHEDLGSGAISAEACRRVRLVWRFGFEDQDIDPQILLPYLSVSVRKADGSIVVDNQSAIGYTDVVERDDETYTITAVTTVNGDECGRTEATIFVKRVQHLHLTAPAELISGTSTKMEVCTSCPTLTGGLTVQLSSTSTALLVPSTATIPEGATCTTVKISAQGDECQNVSVFAQKDDYAAGQAIVQVYREPRIDSVTPDTITSCDMFSLDLTGSCFAPSGNVVQVNQGNNQVGLEILSESPSFIRCRVSNLNIGRWIMRVTSRGLTSLGFELDVEPKTPEIEDFQVEFIPSQGNPQFTPCSSNWVGYSFRVRDASEVILKENGVVIERITSGCGSLNQDATTRLIQKFSVYQLEAVPVGGGLPAVETREVGIKGVPKLTLLNQSGRTLVIWKISGWHNNAGDIPQNQDNKTDLTQNSSMEMTFDDCGKFHVVAIDKQAAQNQNYNPYGNAITINNLRRWEELFIGDANGDSTQRTIP
jgi:hypothetical protein